ncbi:MAG: DNA-directed RNA polymerase subunit omega [Rickettsiales bacterium]|jgi:DNA-directed RNA polymerase subunit omega|nr:DNA-directed RNA polymerase subunit omega [Rickettsiales bacterium]
MARVFIDDCTAKISDRFELVALASERAKELQNGTPAMIERSGDKVTVIALREIAEDKLDLAEVRGNIVLGFRKRRAGDASGGAQSEIEFIEKEIMSQAADVERVAGMSNVSEEELSASV